MKTYMITISSTDSGILQFLSRITDDYQAEYINTDGNGNEVHVLETDKFDLVERQLDTSDEVISYQKV